MFIEIEGIDGVGKSTQCRLLKDYFDSINLDSKIVKELDSTEFSKQIKSILVADIAKDAQTEMFLFLSCKSQVFSQIINPCLKSGCTIIGDRGSGSFISYNKSILDMDVKILERMVNFCSFGTKPDLTILLDAPVEIAKERILEKNEKSRFDLVDFNFLDKQRKIFLELAHDSCSWKVIDATQSINDIQDGIIRHITKLMGN